MKKVIDDKMDVGMDFGWLLDRFLVDFGTRSAQEGAKMSPREPSRASKSKKATFSKTLKNHWFFKVLGVQRLPKRALGGPRPLPRATQGAPKLQQKGI